MKLQIGEVAKSCNILQNHRNRNPWVASCVFREMRQKAPAIFVRCTKDCPASHEKYEGRGWRRCHRNGTQPISSRIRTYHQRQTAVGYQLLCTCLRGAQSRRAMCSRFLHWKYTHKLRSNISQTQYSMSSRKERNIPDPWEAKPDLCIRKKPTLWSVEPGHPDDFGAE